MIKVKFSHGLVKNRLKLLIEEDESINKIKVGKIRKKINNRLRLRQSAKGRILPQPIVVLRPIVKNAASVIACYKGMKNIKLGHALRFYVHKKLFSQKKSKKYLVSVKL